MAAFADLSRRSWESRLQSEACQAAILQSALDAVVVIDHRGQILEWNPARYGCRNVLVPPRLVDDRIGIAIEEPQRDLREWTPQRPSEWFAAIVVNENRPGVHHWAFRDIRPVNPRMAGSPAAGAFRAHACDSHASM